MTRLTAARARVQRGITARSATTAAGVTLFAATVAWRFLTFTGFTNDHYGHLALAQQMLLGDRPIRDFADPGWPLTYLLSAAAWLVAGNTMAVEWALTAAAFALGAACTVVVAQRLSGSLSIAILVTVLEILIYPRTYAYPKVLAYAAGAWALIALAAKPSLRRVVLLAAVIAVAFLLRHDHGLFLGAASAVGVGLASRGDGWRLAAGRVAALTAAAAAFLLPWILFVALNGGLVAYLQTGMEFSRVEFEVFRLRSWPMLSLVPGEALFGLDRPNRPLANTEDLDRVSQPAWREFLTNMSPLRLAPALHSPANADVWLFWLFWSLPLLCGAIVCGRALQGDERWPGELAAMAALCVMATLINATFLRESLRVRVPDAIVPAALLGAWALSLCWTGRWPRRILQSVVRAATVALLFVTVTAISQIAELPDRMANTGIGDGLDGVRIRATEVSDLLRRPHRQDVAPSSRVSAALLRFYSYLDRCTSQSDRLILTGYFPDVLVAAGRRFAGDGVAFADWYSSERYQQRTIERLRARPALFALHLSTDVDFQNAFGLVDAYVRQEYELMAEMPVEDAGSILILALRSRAAVRLDPDTRWPCFR